MAGVIVARNSTTSKATSPAIATELCFEGYLRRHVSGVGADKIYHLKTSLRIRDQRHAVVHGHCPRKARRFKVRDRLINHGRITDVIDAQPQTRWPAETRGGHRQLGSGQCDVVDRKLCLRRFADNDRLRGIGNVHDRVTIKMTYVGVVAIGKEFTAPLKRAGFPIDDDFPKQHRFPEGVFQDLEICRRQDMDPATRQLDAIAVGVQGELKGARRMT